jgi:ABC-type glycerol-3-phosphate transport system substrate-binding protein
MVNAASDNKAATWAFLRYATGKDGGLVYTRAGGQNPRLSILNNAEAAAARPWTPAIVAAAGSGVGTLRIAQSRDFQQTFNRYADMAIAGQLSPEDSLNQATEALKQVLDQSTCK